MRKKKSRWGCGGYLALIIVVLIIGNLFFYFQYFTKHFSRKGPLTSGKSLSNSRSTLSLSDHSGKVILTTPLPPKNDLPASKRKKPPRARIAIVIDDIGYALSPLKRLLALEEPITFAVIPHLSHSAECADMVREAGKELILHLPMEPHQFNERFQGTQPGMLKTGMTGEELFSQWKRNISAVPGALGVNNHMGSKFTEDRRKMAILLGWVKKRGLFFLDSLTSPRSVGWETAGELGMKRARRNIFLDNDNNIPAIEKQWRRLIEIALKKKQAVAIGHPRPDTIGVLARTLPKLHQKGIRLVPLSALVN